MRAPRIAILVATIVDDTRTAAVAGLLEPVRAAVVVALVVVVGVAGILDTAVGIDGDRLEGVVAIVVVLAMRFPTLSGFEHVIACHETYTCHRRNNTFA